MKLIVSSSLIALLMLAGWNFSLRWMPARWTNGLEAGSQWEQNTMKAQQYWSMRGVPRGVVVGSSIAQRLNNLPPGFFNLAMQGDSALTGLWIVINSHKIPPIVLIETNVLTLDDNSVLIDSLNFPVLKSIRLKVPALWETNKPHHVLLRAIMPHRIESGTMMASSQPAHIESVATKADITRRLQQLSHPWPSYKLDDLVNKLHQRVKQIQSAGAEVVFFEMPELAQAYDQPLPHSLRQRIRAEFPEHDYRWIPDVPWSDYQTTDGVHLNSTSVQKYEQFYKLSISTTHH